MANAIMPQSPGPPKRVESHYEYLEYLEPTRSSSAPFDCPYSIAAAAVVGGLHRIKSRSRRFSAEVGPRRRWEVGIRTAHAHAWQYDGGSGSGGGGDGENGGDGRGGDHCVVAAEDLSVQAEVAQADTHERDGARLLHGAE
eukprot:CAMPEP_0119475366 /NCGR_PEP_ID=MMETSP1344-20130328/6283_1 /TAXON_ID=236787 /ORGANISM="Florenciella parvula, Strain CCMP2471" /LENGTH=140 /DNA_ID=CAMNT_0007508873 /DNA_START=173 /DNA_END=592 /DNA_ORIENTATION=-